MKFTLAALQLIQLSCFAQLHVINKETEDNYCLYMASPPATMHTFMMMHRQATLLIVLTMYGSPKVAITLESQYCA